MNREIVEKISRLVEEVYLKEKETGFESLDGMRQGVAHYVAEQIVENNDTSLLDHCPEWVKVFVFEYIRVYEEEGEVVIYSSVGKTDHSVMAKSLFNLLGAK